MKAFAMAWRNVWRNSRRTLATVSAMTLALLTVILQSGMFDGYMRGLERNMLDLEMGDVQIFAPGYQRSPSLYKKIKAPDALLLRLDDEGFWSAPRLIGSGLAAAGETSCGVSLRGVDVIRDGNVGAIAQHLASGAWLSDSAPDGVVVGKRVAKMLGVGVGDKVTVLSQAADGSMANALYVVRGVLQSIGDAVDRGGFYMTAAAFRDLMVMPTGAQQVIVRFMHKSDLAGETARIQKLAPGLEVRSWRQLSPTMASMLDSSRAAMIVMFFIVYMAVSIVIFNAILMAVFERLREFGVLKAVGVGPFDVVRLILLESMLQATLAVVSAVLISIPCNWYLVTHGIDLSSGSIMGIAMDPIWRAELSVHGYTTPIILLFVTVFAAAIYPAMRAALVAPIVAMRSQS